MNQDFLVMSREGRVFDWTEVGVMQYESVIDISYLILCLTVILLLRFNNG